jgi:hypothetical protein
MKVIEYSVWHPDGNIDYVADQVSADELAQQVGGFVIPIVETEEINTLIDEAAKEAEEEEALDLLRDEFGSDLLGDGDLYE